MSPRGRAGGALLLVTVCMVRAYPQSINQTAEGSGESGQYQQHYASDLRTSYLHRNSGPSTDSLRLLAQNMARNQQQQLPGQEFQEPPEQAVSRRLGNNNYNNNNNKNNNRPPLQQPHRQSEHHQTHRQILPQKTYNRPHNHQQQNVHRAQYRSIQPAGRDNLPHNNDDQNKIDKQRTINVDTNQERTAAISRAYLSPPEGRHRTVESQRFSEELKTLPQSTQSTRRFSEELKMQPQSLSRFSEEHKMPQQSIVLQSRGHATVPVRGHTTAPVQRRNTTSVSEERHQNSFDMPAAPARSSSGSAEGIVFPDQKFTVPRIGASGPNCTNGLTFCENIDGYPTKQISELIKKSPSLFKSLFFSDVLVPEIANRISPDEELCKYNEHIAYPKLGKNKDDEWAWIANTEEFKQGVRVEVCQNKGNECLLSGNWPMGYVTECKQKNIYRRLLSVSKDGSPSTDEFLFPSCCVCSVKKTDKK